MAGVFVKERIRALAALPGYDIRVISPVPYFPPIRQCKRWYQWSQFPAEETVEGLRVLHPRYLLPPKIGGYFHADLLYPFVKKAVERLRRDFDFDLIDAHWVFPSGVVGVMLARRFDKPVVATGRGEDMLVFPRLPLKGRRIRYALRGASQLIALSSEIADAMRNHGAAADRITTIPNGVDCTTFRPLDRQETRRKLGLPEDAKIILSVGELLELKGFHVLVDALPEIQKRFPGALLVIVGGPGRFGRDYTAEIKRRIQQQNLTSSVLLAGPRPHDELVRWYNAADVLALLSSREGSPNVVMEALACGTPVVATPVGSVPDQLGDPALGLVLRERSLVAAGAGITQALSQRWNRRQIRRAAERRSWEVTAGQVGEVFDRATTQYLPRHL
jgi:glycosyltransferase involved in cell wall biosynthesis